MKPGVRVPESGGSRSTRLAAAARSPFAALRSYAARAVAESPADAARPIAALLDDDDPQNVLAAIEAARLLHDRPDIEERLHLLTDHADPDVATAAGELLLEWEARRMDAPKPPRTPPASPAPQVKMRAPAPAWTSSWTTIPVESLQEAPPEVPRVAKPAPPPKLPELDPEELAAVLAPLPPEPARAPDPVPPAAHEPPPSSPGLRLQRRAEPLPEPRPERPAPPPPPPPRPRTPDAAPRPAPDSGLRTPDSEQTVTRPLRSDLLLGTAVAFLAFVLMRPLVPIARTEQTVTALANGPWQPVAPARGTLDARLGAEQVGGAYPEIAPAPLDAGDAGAVTPEEDSGAAELSTAAIPRDANLSESDFAAPGRPAASQAPKPVSAAASIPPLDDPRTMAAMQEMLESLQAPPERAAEHLQRARALLKSSPAAPPSFAPAAAPQPEGPAHPDHDRVVARPAAALLPAADIPIPGSPPPLAPVVSRRPRTGLKGATPARRAARSGTLGVWLTVQSPAELAQIYTTLAKHHLDHRNYDQARYFAEKVLSTWPDHADARRLRDAARDALAMGGAEP